MSLILSFTCNFFAYFKFHSDLGRVIGKIKQNELDCGDTAPLRRKLFARADSKKYTFLLLLHMLYKASRFVISCLEGL